MGKIDRNFSRIDITLSCVLVFAILVSGMFVDKPVYGALVCVIFGFVSIYSRRLKDSFFLFSVVNWIVMNIFKPKTRLNHLIWGVFLIVIGGICTTLPSPSGPEKEYLKGVHQTVEFWIGIVIVIVFNIAVGVYTARQKKKGGNNGIRE